MKLGHTACTFFSRSLFFSLLSSLEEEMKNVFTLIAYTHGWEKNALVTYQIQIFYFFLLAFDDFYFTHWFFLRVNTHWNGIWCAHYWMTILKKQRKKIGNRNVWNSFFFHLFVFVVIVVVDVVASSNDGELTLKYAYTFSVQQSTRETVCNIILLIYT